MDLKKIETDLIKEAGHLSFFGFFAQQNPQAFLSFNRLLNAYDFTNIVELGTFGGGFSALFAIYAFNSNRKLTESGGEFDYYAKRANSQHHKNPKKFYTYDWVTKDSEQIKFLLSLGAEFKQMDTLHNENNINYIGDIIQKPGRTLLLCDGGNKIGEIHLYSKFLKSGDFIMAHDWAYDDDAFENNKKNDIWFWKEITNEDIKDVLETNSVERIYADEFDNVAWFCGKKK